MTATIILEILSILMLMLFALPGTQILWSRRGKKIWKKGHMEIMKSGNCEIVKLGIQKNTDKEVITIRKRFRVEAAKIAASLF